MHCYQPFLRRKKLLRNMVTSKPQCEVISSTEYISRIYCEAESEVSSTSSSPPLRISPSYSSSSSPDSPDMEASSPASADSNRLDGINPRISLNHTALILLHPSRYPCERSCCQDYYKSCARNINTLDAVNNPIRKLKVPTRASFPFSPSQPPVKRTTYHRHQVKTSPAKQAAEVFTSEGTRGETRPTYSLKKSSAGHPLSSRTSPFADYNSVTKECRTDNIYLDLKPKNGSRNGAVVEEQQQDKGFRSTPQSLLERLTPSVYHFSLPLSLSNKKKNKVEKNGCDTFMSPAKTLPPKSKGPPKTGIAMRLPSSGYEDLSETGPDRESEEARDSSPYEGEDVSSPFSSSSLPSSTMEGRGNLSAKNSPALYVGANGTLGRASPCHDLGYHTLVTRQIPPPTPVQTPTVPTRDGTTPSPWSDVRASPFTVLDLSALTSCPRSSPRPQPPQVPSQQVTPSPGPLDCTDQLITSYKGKRLMRGSPFDKLSNDLLKRIFSFLPANSLCHCATVCRRWYQVVWDHTLWSSITLSGENINVDKAIKQISRLLSRDGRGCHHVNKIVLNGCSRLSDKGLSLIARRCPELRHLELKGCVNITNNGVFDIASQCTNLQHLDLTGCHNITCISVTPQGIMEPEISHPRQLYLQCLDMSDCYVLKDRGLLVIVKNCPHLLNLYLRRCTNITDVGIKYMASYCMMLREVSISDCVQITDFGMYELAKLGPNLRYLSVAKCDQISDAGIKQIARHCYKLRYLNVRGCEAVSDDSMEMVARSCPRLRALDIGKCDVTDNGMKFLSEHCPNLKKLSVKSCDMITDKGIQYIAYYCRGLQQLNIQDCQVTLEGYRTVKKYCRRCIIEHTNPGFF